MIDWDSLLSTSRNQALCWCSSAWHTHAILLYRPAGAVLNTIPAGAAEPLFHFYSTSAALQSAEQRAARANSHFRYFSPVPPARSARPSQPGGGGGPARRGRREIRWFSDCSGQQCYWLTFGRSRSVRPSVRPSWSSWVVKYSLLPLARVATAQSGLRRRINTLLVASAWDSKGSRNSRFLSYCAPWSRSCEWVSLDSAVFVEVLSSNQSDWASDSAAIMDTSPWKVRM